jgi:competence protein ComFC
MFEKILREINPGLCLNCSEKTVEKAGLCNSCFNSLPLVLNPGCPACGAENDGIFEICPKCVKEEKRPWAKAIALMRMEGTGQELIHRFKYGNETAVARLMGELAAERIKKENIEFDFIVPVPLHFTRQLTRGYNQTELFSLIVIPQDDGMME